MLARWRVGVAVLVGLVGACAIAAPESDAAEGSPVLWKAPSYRYDASSAPTTSAVNLRTLAIANESASTERKRLSTLATGLKRAARGGGAGLEGISRSYVDITKGRSSIRNIGTDARHTEFSETLTAGGWSSRTVGNGKATLFEKDGARYSLREQAGSYGGWTAEYTPAGATSQTLKIRLGYP